MLLSQVPNQREKKVCEVGIKLRAAPTAYFLKGVVDGPRGRVSASARVDGTTDFTGKVVVRGLAPGAAHSYRVRFVDGDGDARREGEASSGKVIGAV